MKGRMGEIVTLNRKKFAYSLIKISAIARKGKPLIPLSREWKKRVEIPWSLKWKFRLEFQRFFVIHSYLSAV